MRVPDEAKAASLAEDEAVRLVANITQIIEAKPLLLDADIKLLAAKLEINIAPMPRGNGQVR